MKKILLLLVLVTLSNAFSQYSKIWENVVGGSGTPSWFANDNSTRGLSFDAVNNYVYICSRTGGHNIYYLNAGTGAVLGQLNMTGVTGGTYNLNLVKVSEDGVIYACNLALANGNFRVYRWANKDAVPTVAYEAIAVTARYGDAFAVVGSGANTLIYASGTGNTKIAVLSTTDGSAFTLNKEITMAGGYGSGSISPEGNTLTSAIWVNTSGFPVYKIDQSGVIQDSVSTGVISSGWRNVMYFTVGAEKFLAVSGKNDAAEGKKIAFFNITSGAYFPRPAGYYEYSNTYNANANATSDLAINKKQDGSIIIFNVVSNNGYAALKMNPMAYFSVNMKIQILKKEFKPAEDQLFVRGSFNGWGQPDTLKDTDNDSIYTKLVILDSLGTKDFKFMFRKVAAASDKWEGDPNRSFNFTQLYTVYDGGYFDKDSVYAERDSIDTYFQCGMELERLSGRFNPAKDSVSVNGSFQGWSALKNLLKKNPINPDIYEGNWKIFVGVGENIEFKFWYTPNNWESVANRKYVFTQADFTGKTAFYAGSFNNGTLATVLNQDATLKFTVNAKNAVNAVSGNPFASVNTVHAAGSTKPLSWPAGGWPNSDSTILIKFYDDGTHGDATAGDKIFTNFITFTRYTGLYVEYKYGINWGDPTTGGNDNEGGFGTNHQLTMNRLLKTATVIDTFGRVGPTTLTDVVLSDVRENQPIPASFELSQNYPNPFNPSTVISYSIPKAGNVTLKVYDMLGSEIATLVDGKREAGKYTATFDASNLSSGTYIYKIQSGDFVSIKKMMFVK